MFRHADILDLRLCDHSLRNPAELGEFGVDIAEAPCDGQSSGVDSETSLALGDRPACSFDSGRLDWVSRSVVLGKGE